MLDNPGDDFMTGSIDTYTLKIKFKNLKKEDIQDMWIRRSKLTSLNGAYKPENIKVIANGKVIVNKNINQWISGFSKYYINK
ncbi:PLAT/LH2 domain-containing protein [Clostridium perfringens]|uniref:PLAT/LH2 domain-containing protein n=2 Tax=Clostridium perfringens TaxID=1502 RepID=UPI00311A9389